MAVSAVAVMAAASIHVAPGTVDAGGRVSISGSARGCPEGDRVTLLSRAFSHRHDFAGVPAVFARVRRDGSFGHSVRIPAGTAPARYTITGRCGGGNLGVTAHLRVRRSNLR